MPTTATTTMTRDRIFVLPIPHEKPRQIEAHVYKHGPEPANVWFSVRSSKEYDELDDHESELATGFEADVTTDTAKKIDSLGKESLEHQEDTVTKAFFETVLRSSDSRDKLVHSYPGWATQLVRYLHDQSTQDDVKTEYYFQLDSRLEN